MDKVNDTLWTEFEGIVESILTKNGACLGAAWEFCIKAKLKLMGLAFLTLKKRARLAEILFSRLARSQKPSPLRWQ